MKGKLENGSTVELTCNCHKGETGIVISRMDEATYRIQLFSAPAGDTLETNISDLKLTTPPVIQGTGHPMFYELLKKIGELHSAKNKDYTQGGNPLGNFSRVADTISSYGRATTPAQVSFTYMMKQVDAAGRMLFQGYEGKTEGLKERLMDVAVYALLTIINKKEE